MSSVVSTAISELIVCALSAWCANQLFLRQHRGAAIPMGIIAVTGLLGAARFAGEPYFGQFHPHAAWVATIAAFPAFCWAFWSAFARRRGASIVEIVAVIIALCAIAWTFSRPVAFAFGGYHVPYYDIAIGALGLVLVVIGAVRSRVPVISALGITGAALYAFAGLVVGTEGEWLELLRVDIYHGVIAAANVLLTLALVEQRGGIYRPK